MRFILFLLLLVAVISCSTSKNYFNGPTAKRSTASAGYPLFDRGPDPEDPMQKELLEIIRDLPNVPGISKQLQVLVPSYKRGQKMRPDFGAMPLRGFLEPNSVKVLVIGQDGTHIAEGANRPGIAGFGGRVQDMLLHFGVYDSVLFTNLFVNTISGQYGSRNTPVLVNDRQVEYLNVIENRQWMLTHEGAYGKWRNRLLSWVIRNNKDSLKMVMMLGQAGKDAGANFINAIGGEVGTRGFIRDASHINVPQFEMVSAGGNNEWAVPVTKDGKDVAEFLRANKRDEVEEGIKSAVERLEARIDSLSGWSKTKAQEDLKNFNVALQNLGRRIDYKSTTGQALQKAILIGNPELAKKYMVFSKGGKNRNGILRAPQILGWDLTTMKVNGKRTRSIEGLKVPCFGECKEGPVTAPDIVFVGAPHPTALSKGSKSSASAKVEKDLMSPLRSAMRKGWEPPSPEPGLDSPFIQGKKYRYGRGVIPTSHGDPGITDLRLLPVSTAKRQGSAVIVIGTRDRASFSKSALRAMENDTPSTKSLPRSNLVLTGRTKFPDQIEHYDRGPSRAISEVLFKSMKKAEVLKYKSKHNTYANQFMSAAKRQTDKSLSDEENEEIIQMYLNRKVFDNFGIDAFDFKTHPDAGFFGHYRGTFESPKAIILSDPVGYDSFITSKAATGERGQHLHGLMEDLGYGDQYLVISTVPMGMDGASSSEWSSVLKRTAKWRDQLFKMIDMGDAQIIADGKHAAAELERILGKGNFKTINQTSDHSQDMQNFDSKAKGKRIDIPKKHLTWIARTWEGTSGDRVITATDKANKGKAFAIVAPKWARRNKVKFFDSTESILTDQWNELASAGEPMPGEKLSDFVRRRAACASSFEIEQNVDGVSNKKPCAETVKAPRFP